jgi:hypothetical protein
VASAFEKLSQLLRALNVEGVRYVLFGGQAVNLHGIARFTEDIDLFVEPTADNIGRLRRALTDVWNDPEIDKICIEDLAGEYAVVRYGTPDGFAVDLVGRIGEMFEFEDVESETVMVGDVPARLATARMLYRMKKDTVRPIDHADAADLKAKFNIKDD